MRVVISACTHRAFSYGLMPLARLMLRPLDAVNDNHVQSQVRSGIAPSNYLGSSLAFHTKRVAYGRVEFVIAVLVLIMGIFAVPLLQTLAVPIMTASEERPEILSGSPIAPALLQPRENG